VTGGGARLPPCPWRAKPTPHDLSKTYSANRVVRGGSWNNQAQTCRAAYRNRNHPGNHWNNQGLRLAAAHPPRSSTAADPVFDLLGSHDSRKHPAAGDW